MCSTPNSVSASTIALTTARARASAFAAAAQAQRIRRREHLADLGGERGELIGPRDRAVRDHSTLAPSPDERWRVDRSHHHRTAERGAWPRAAPTRLPALPRRAPRLVGCSALFGSPPLPRTALVVFRTPRSASLTASADGNAAATSGSRSTRLLPFRSRATYLPRTPPVIVAKSYSGLRSSPVYLPLRWPPFTRRSGWSAGPDSRRVDRAVGAYWGKETARDRPALGPPA